MREYKFRGITEISRKWIYGDLLHYCGNEVWCIRYYEDEDFEAKIKEVDPETVGQWTGAKDANGVDIFEGDIWKEYGTKAYIIMVVCEVRWDEKRKTLGFAFPEISCDGYNYYDMSIADLGVVIGNIHSNPELLKEVK